LDFVAIVPSILLSRVWSEIGERQRYAAVWADLCLFDFAANFFCREKRTTDICFDARGNSFGRSIAVLPLGTKCGFVFHSWVPFSHFDFSYRMKGPGIRAGAQVKLPDILVKLRHRTGVHKTTLARFLVRIISNRLARFRGQFHASDLLDLIESFIDLRAVDNTSKELTNFKLGQWLWHLNGRAL
jgi:hypothetical protein